MVYTRLVTILCLVVVLATTVACAPKPAPTPIDPAAAEAAAVATAEVALAPVLGTGAGSRSMPASLEDEVAKAQIIVISKVAGLGPIFNSAREGDSMESGPNKIFYSLAQVYEIQVERYLKGTGPELIRTAQVEGQVRGSFAPTAVNVKVARSKYQYVPMVVGNRYLFLLDEGDKVPELGSLLVLGGATYPPRYLLTSDGNATIEEIQGAALLRQVLNPGTEHSLITRIEKAVADQKQ